MRPEDIARAMAETTKKLRGADADAPLITERVAREVAASVKGLSQRNKHSIGIRVVTQGGQVRLTVTGPHAMRYRRLVEEEMQRRAPDIKAEIRAQITRRIK